MRAPGQHGIAGVMVSNGRDVVATDSAGRWALPVETGDSIFVIAPRQWTTAKCGQAKFFYLHQPRGTPAGLGLRTPSIAPTGPLPASIDFPLQRQAQSQRFDVLLFADTQAADKKELGYVRQVLLDATRGSNAAFSIHHGDAMGDDLALFPEYLNILRETGMTWHHCPGNHDLNLDADDPRYAFEAWKRFIGPPNYAFQHGNATFIMLNNVEYFGCGGHSVGGRAYRGHIGENQLRFVSNVLRHVPVDDLIVISMHVPLESFDKPDSAADTTADRAALLDLLSDRPHSVSFAGHSHTTEHQYLRYSNDLGRGRAHHHQVLTAACGSWWSGPEDESGVPIADSRDGTPKGFHILSIDGNSYTTRFVPFGNVPDDKVRILVHAVDESFEGQPALLVDVFDGGPLTRVMCEVNGVTQRSIELRRADVADPYVVDAYARYRHLCKPWVAAARSSHVWASALPPDAVSHGSELVVRVTDAHGRLFERRISAG